MLRLGFFDIIFISFYLIREIMEQPQEVYYYSNMASQT